MQISRMVHDWILQQIDFGRGGGGGGGGGGVGSNGRFFDGKVFNPYTPSNQKTPLSACYRSHETRKRGNMTNVSVKLNMHASNSIYFLLHC